jgi:hypothetical protein
MLGGDRVFSIYPFLQSHPNIDNELRAKHVNTRSTPASRRGAQKIGRSFSAGYLPYAIGPAPEGRGEQTGQRRFDQSCFPKTNLCFLEALGWLMFLLVRGCQRSGQLIEMPTSPRPFGTGIFPYSRMPVLKRRPIFKAPLRGASSHRAI